VSLFNPSLASLSITSWFVNPAFRSTLRSEETASGVAACGAAASKEPTVEFVVIVLTAVVELCALGVSSYIGLDAIVAGKGFPENP
jgi:hypothetical protein